jgi:hypothetical protein
MLNARSAIGTALLELGGLLGLEKVIRTGKEKWRGSAWGIFR